MNLSFVRQLKLAILFCGVVSFASFFASCGLGTQPAVVKSIGMTPDRTKVVVLFTEYHVTSIKKSGGFTQRSGYDESFFRVYDAETGSVVNQNPFEIDENGDIVLITDSCVYLNVYDRDLELSLLHIYNIQTGKKMFDGKALFEANNKVYLDPNGLFWHNNELFPRLFKGDDARIYAVNESNGSYSRVEDSLAVRYGSTFQRFTKLYSVSDDEFSISLTGKNREHLEFENRRNGRSDKEFVKKQCTSAEDYIDAGILGTNSLIKRRSVEVDELPLFMDSTLFVFSKSKDSRQFEWIFSAYRIPDCAMLWSQQLKNPLMELQEEEIKEVVLRETDLFILTNQSINCLNAKTGAWKYQVRLIHEIEE